MSTIDTRAPFFPRSKNVTAKDSAQAKGINSLPQRNTPERVSDIAHTTADDAKVNINDAIKDFSRIKKAVDASPAVDNTDKIAMLKAKINSGEYQMDYDGIADRMLMSEF